MSDPEDKQRALKTPIEGGEGTTPSHTPPSSSETAAFNLSDSVLRSLAERFEFSAELGRGGMGIVYKARDRETGEIVALKVLKPEIVGQPDLIERFKSELRLARKITHKNVCRVYDLHRFGQTAAIAMEYIEGENLRTALNRPQGFSVRKGLDIACQVVAGLSEAHAQGVIHRDLKPENVVITRDGTVRLMDFGIARSLEVGATQTGTGTVIGTPAYMSPEQAEGKPADARSDIYSLGLMMYEIFTGKPALRADTPVAYALKQLRETPPRPGAIDPDIPERIDATIQQCLEKDPKKRFQSLAEVEAALTEKRLPEAAPESEPLPAPHLSVWGRWDWALLAIGLIGVLYFLAYRDTVFPASRMRLEADALTARREVDALATKLERRLPPFSWSQLELHFGQYVDVVISRVLDPLHRGGKDPRAELAKIELPLRWRVNFSVVPNLWVEQLIRESPPDYALVDLNGRVVAFHSPISTPAIPSYKPPTIEQRRQIGRRAAELACGPLPGDIRIMETAGGEFGASYEITWLPIRPVGSPPWGSVRLLAEKVQDIECQYASPALPSGLSEVRGLLRGMEFVYRLALLFTFGQFLFLFALGQGHRSANVFWKRMPLALLLGFSSAWILPRAFGLTGISLPGTLASALAATALFLVGLVAVESLLVRWVPSRVASYLWLLRGRVLEPAVGLAVVRGALGGLALAATLTALVHFSLLYISAVGNRFALALTAVLIDPAAIGHAIESFSPALYVLCSAILSGWALGFTVLGGTLASSQKRILKAPNKQAAHLYLLLGMSAMFPMVAIALRLPVHQYFSFGMGYLVSPMLAGLLAGLLLLRYDVLTLIFAIVTSTLLTMSFPLLDIFQDVGNTAYWALLLGWAAVVAAGAVVAFRAELARAIQRQRAELR